MNDSQLWREDSLYSLTFVLEFLVYFLHCLPQLGGTEEGRMVLDMHSILVRFLGVEQGVCDMLSLGKIKALVACSLDSKDVVPKVCGASIRELYFCQ